MSPTQQPKQQPEEHERQPPEKALPKPFPPLPPEFPALHAPGKVHDVHLTTVVAVRCALRVLPFHRIPLFVSYGRSIPAPAQTTKPSAQQHRSSDHESHNPSESESNPHIRPDDNNRRTNPNKAPPHPPYTNPFIRHSHFYRFIVYPKSTRRHTPPETQPQEQYRTFPADPVKTCRHTTAQRASFHPIRTSGAHNGSDTSPQRQRRRAQQGRSWSSPHRSESAPAHRHPIPYRPRP